MLESEHPEELPWWPGSLGGGITLVSDEISPWTHADVEPLAHHLLEQHLCTTSLERHQKIHQYDSKQIPNRKTHLK
jgi:hypothetical protein